MLVVALSVVMRPDLKFALPRADLLDRGEQADAPRPDAPELVDDHLIGRPVGDGDLHLVPALLKLLERGPDDRRGAGARRAQDIAYRPPGDQNDHRRHQAELQGEQPIVHSDTLQEELCVSKLFREQAGDAKCGSDSPLLAK